MSRNLAVASAVAIIAVCGVAHGLRAERWHQSAALEEALARFKQSPMEIGDWKGEALEGDAKAFAQAGAQAYWTRIYTNVRNRRSVLVILMCGRAGRMAVHTPERCYRGAGYELYDKPAPTPLRNDAGEE